MYLSKVKIIIGFLERRRRKKKDLECERVWRGFIVSD